jgi:hypothetical protein
MEGTTSDHSAAELAFARSHSARSFQSGTAESHLSAPKLPENMAEPVNPYDTGAKDFVNAKAFLLQASSITGLNL